MGYKGYESFNSPEFENYLRSLTKEEGLLVKNTGTPDSLNLKPGNVLNVLYETPMVAHHTMETMNCIAHVQGDKVEIWTSTQVPSTITGSGAGDMQ